MIRVVEAQTSNDPEFPTREGGKELFDGENRLGDLRAGVEYRADDFVGFDGLLVPCGETDWEEYELKLDGKTKASYRQVLGRRAGRGAPGMSLRRQSE